MADDENSPEPDAPDANAPITDPDAASEAPDAGAARPTPLEIVQKIPVTKAVDGARSLAANPDARRFVAGALVGALALWAGGIVFRGDDAGNGSASEAKVEALRADLAELRADLAELRVAGGSAASHSETTDAHTDATHTGDTHTDTTDAGHGDDGHGTTDDTHAADEPPHWTYSEADAWGEIADEYIECAEGQEQSPIDLSTEWEEVPSTSDFEYDAVPVTVTDNGHTIQVSAEGAGTVSQEHHDYELVQFHFHAPSEHTIDGEHHDVEVHLVHKDADDKLAVVGVMIDEGAPLPGFDAVLDAIGEPGEEQSAGEFDPTALLPDELTFFHYRGSLTTPPCSEGVSWRVMAEPITMSAAQIEELTSHFAEANNRPVQPRNGRDAHIDV